MDIKVPHLAEGVESGTVVSVLVKEGDKVKKEQGLVELETNKAVANIPSNVDGVVSKVHVSEGSTVNVGQILVSVSENAQAPASQEGLQTPIQKSASKPAAAAGSAPLAYQPTSAQASPSSGAYQYHSPAGAPPPASPSVRRLARELGIDLSRVRGTEEGGRITLADVRDYVSYLQQAALNPQPEAQAPVQTSASTRKTSPPSPSIDFSKWGPVTKKPMTPLRKTIAQAMVNSWTTIPHVTQFDDIDIKAVNKLRKKYEKAYENAGARLTLTAFILKAVALTLKSHLILNSSLDEVTHEMIYKEYVHLGIAVDTEQGLMVPVMRNVDQKSLLQISKELQELAQKTRDRKLAVEDMRGGTFTISNQGGIGGKHFTPIINKPEVAILGVGRGKDLMPVGLSYDHRVLDGGSAARFIVDFSKAMNEFKDSDVALAGSKPTKKIIKKKSR